MTNQIKLTTNEAVARLKGNWKADIAAYDKVRAEILKEALVELVARPHRPRHQE